MVTAPDCKEAADHACTVVNLLVHATTWSSADGFFWCCSGLPPASSLFTDSEASSEAEEDRAALHSPAQSLSAVLSNKRGQTAGVSANTEPSQRHDGTRLKQSQLMAAPGSSNQVCLDG